MIAGMTSTVHLSGTLHLSDCEGDLVCFDRDATDKAGPPGCLGSPLSAWDYCYVPLLERTLDDVAANPDDLPLSLCQGDCDSDR